jgi:phospholipid/cholesterol/gamma-HCH transport system substrate-binding protein
MKFKHSKEFTIGLCVIAAIAVLFFGIEYLKGNNLFKPANYYYATYTNVAGLAQSVPVSINGFKVGVVREISYDYAKPGNINVEMSLDKALRLPIDTKAVLTTDMLGTSAIELILGTSSEYHEVGNQLVASRGESLMSGITENVMPSVSNILPKIDSLITSLNALASDPALKQTIGSLENTMANLEATSDKLNKVMSTIPSIANNASETMGNVKEISSNLNTFTAQLKDMPLDSTMTNVMQTSESLKELMARLNAKDSSLGMILNDDQLYRNLNNATASLDSLLQDVKKNPKRYISIKLL